jgi:hypothetical protein
MPHTKRSPHFVIEVRRLRDKAKAGTLDAEERARVAHILEFNTTDAACLTKAHEDEPIFVLRAHDGDADKCVDHWCELQIERTLWKDDKPLAKIADARDCAREMREWPDRKVAD